MGDNMFHGLKAWFSTSVAGSTKQLWIDNGGEETNFDQANFVFSSDNTCADTVSLYQSEAYQEEHLAVFHSRCITDCIAAGNRTKVTLGRYFMPPSDIMPLIRTQVTFCWDDAPPLSATHEERRRIGDRAGGNRPPAPGRPSAAQRPTPTPTPTLAVKNNTTAIQQTRATSSRQSTRNQSDQLLEQGDQSRRDQSDQSLEQGDQSRRDQSEQLSGKDRSKGEQRPGRDQLTVQCQPSPAKQRRQSSPPPAPRPAKSAGSAQTTGPSLRASPRISAQQAHSAGGGQQDTQASHQSRNEPSSAGGGHQDSQASHQGRTRNGPSSAPTETQTSQPADNSSEGARGESSRRLRSSGLGDDGRRGLGSSDRQPSDRSGSLPGSGTDRSPSSQATDNGVVGRRQSSQATDNGVVGRRQSSQATDNGVVGRRQSSQATNDGRTGHCSGVDRRQSGQLADSKGGGRGHGGGSRPDGARSGTATAKARSTRRTPPAGMVLIHISQLSKVDRCHLADFIPGCNGAQVFKKGVI